MKVKQYAMALAMLAPLVASLPAEAADLGGGPRRSMKDDYVEYSPPPPRFNWAGIYVGAHVGGAFGSSKHTDLAGTTSGGFDTDGYIAGGQIGFNLQSGALVYGLEADISGTDISGGTFSATCPAGCSSQLDWIGTIRARVGWDLGGYMPYLTGGFAYGDASASTNGISANDTLTGWTVGGGLEMKLTNNWTLRGEYLYVDLGHLNVPTAVPVRADFDELHLVRAGLNFKF